ncbi:MAG TPA: hypothetical protein VEU96_12800 [Bryobacteraceae bacterium]|nr:hypothetical protein [Bryobacteraceae bacterium]
MSKKVSIPVFVLLMGLVLMMPSTASARGHWSFGVSVGPPVYYYPPPVVYDYPYPYAYSYPYPYYSYYYPYRPYRYYSYGYGFGWRGGHERFERRGRVVREFRGRGRR